MQNIYLSTTYASALIFLLISLLLFSRRHDGERSRIILACITLISVFNYMTRFIDTCQGNVPQLVVSTPMLLRAILMTTSYIMYPIEVVSPGYLNFRRIVKLYIPWVTLWGIYLLCLGLGITFKPYDSLVAMLPHATKFEVWFRLLLVLLIFLPVLMIFFIPYTRRYNNAGKEWMNKYILFFTINSMGFILLLTSDSIYIKTLYYYVSMGCSIGIAYMELFGRLIGKATSQEVPTELGYIEPSKEVFGYIVEPLEESPDSDEKPVMTKDTSHKKRHPLCDKLQSHMNQTYAYRDPDISINSLATELHTNRTTLTLVIQELGYESFPIYINKLRIDDFIKLVQNGNEDCFQTAFYNAGFRSRATATRNFKLITGYTPSEYFKKQHITGEDYGL